MENKAKFVPKIENITVFLTGIFLLIFPVFLLTLTTDALIIPKQAALAIVVIIGVVLLGIKSVFNEGVRIRRTPFDLPIILLILAALISAILSVNKIDSFISFVPFLFAGLLYFIVTNSVKRQQDFLFITGSLIVGAIGISLISLLSYFKIFILPFEFAKFQTFTPFGSLFDQAMYLALVFALCLYMAWPSIRRRAIDKSRLIYLVGGFFVLIGLVVSLVGIVTLPRPQTGSQILNMQTGFQTAFASISQDQGRVVQGLLSGSGIGTYVTDFTRFKPASFNNNVEQWNLTFLRSSSFFLELLATTGLLGILAFIFLAYRIIRTKPLFVPLILALVFALTLPFAYTLIVLFFALLAIYSAQQGLNERNKTKFFDVELKLLSLKKGVLALDSTTSRRESEYGNLLPYLFLGLTILFAGALGYQTVKFVYSDYLFQQSLVAASKNDVQKTYDLQMKAIEWMPERDGYRRIFSQINLNLANNFANSIPQGASPSAEQQQTIYQLIQASITNGRAATEISPLSTANWQNLASIYRSLIGFGQNADQFALLASQQALILDPNNPQQYINYGGIFYQLEQWDNAIRQFQIAASLKPDFANAYYNLGHALEQKGDLQNALIQYQRVKSLVSKDPQSSKAIDEEIKALQAKIGTAVTNEPQPTNNSAQNQPALGIDRPTSQLPEQNPPVKIPAPETSITPSKSPSPSPTTAPEE